MKRLLIFFSFYTLAGISMAQVVVSMSLDTADILIGEQILLHTQVSAPTGSRVEYPPIVERGIVTHGVEVVAVGKIDTTLLNEGKSWLLTRNYTITSFDSALYQIPPFKISINGREYTSNTPIGLKVFSIPVDTTKVELFDGLRPPVSGVFTWNKWLVLSFIIFLLLIGLCGWGYVRWKRLPKEKMKIIRLPQETYHHLALRKINELKERFFNGSTVFPSYYDELTEILRDYIEERYHIRTSEMTSDEIIAALIDTHDNIAIAELQDILTTADLVKFAQLQAPVKTQSQNLLQAIAYIQQNKGEELLQEKEVVVVDTAHRRRYWGAIIALTIGVLTIIALLYYLLDEAYLIFF